MLKNDCAGENIIKHHGKLQYIQFSFSQKIAYAFNMRKMITISNITLYNIDKHLNTVCRKYKQNPTFT